MFFTITAYKQLLGFGDTYRLKNDRSWQKIEDFETFNSDEDLLFSSYREAELFIQAKPQFEINGEPMDWIKYESSHVGDFGSTFHFKIIVHQTENPKNRYPTKEQVKSVLINGDDDYNNFLVIDFDGFPNLIRRVAGTPLTGYPVRFETFNAGNRYVGPHSQLNHLDDTTFISMGIAYVQYQSTHAQVDV